MSLARIHADIMRRLPARTRTLVAVLGWEDTLKFLRKHGGKKLYFPVYGARRKASWIDSYSDTVQQGLSESFGGSEIRTPQISRMLFMERDSQILADKDRGFTARDLCEKYGLPRRTINHLLAITGGNTLQA